MNRHIPLTGLAFSIIKCYDLNHMKDFKKFGDSRGGGRPSFGGKPSFNKFGGDRGGNRGGDRGDRPVVMHTATCAECGKKCEVPFRPNGEKPVFCNDCFGAKREGSFDRPQKRDFESGRPSFNKPERREESRPHHDHAHVHAPHAESRPDPRVGELKQQVEMLSAKLDSVIAMIASTKKAAPAVESKPEPMKKAAKPTTAPKVAVKAAPKAVAKKSAPVKKVAAPKAVAKAAPKKVAAKKK
jgi:CxxC-x17-CxxC domain-containing protein